MAKKRLISEQTRNNWVIVFGLLVSGMLTFLSGIYFLFLPSGYQGGRNAMYGIIIFFDRHTWQDLHIWSSIIALALILIHIPLHWGWIVNMTKRVFKIMLGRCKSMNPRGKFNLYLDGLVGLIFLLSALSGLYFLLVPGASHKAVASATTFLFSGAIWDLIHTWSGVVASAAILLHFAIHWRWFLKVSRKILVMPRRGQVYSSKSSLVRAKR